MKLPEAAVVVLAEGGRQFDPEVVTALEDGMRGGEVDVPEEAGIDGVPAQRRRRPTTPAREVDEVHW